MKTHQEPIPLGLNVARLPQAELETIAAAEESPSWAVLRSLLAKEADRVKVQMFDPKNADHPGLLARLTGEMEILEKVIRTPEKAKAVLRVLRSAEVADRKEKR
jgi:hypothetical protein